MSKLEEFKMKDYLKMKDAMENEGIEFSIITCKDEGTVDIYVPLQCGDLMYIKYKLDDHKDDEVVQVSRYDSDKMPTADGLVADVIHGITTTYYHNVGDRAIDIGKYIL